MNYTTKELTEKAYEIRKDIIDMLLEAKSGHSAGALGMADVFTALYFEVLNHDPNNPHMPERDKVILSNGHINPVLYATLASAGYFPKEELMKLRKIDSLLQGHPNHLDTPGVENSSGPLGQGISQAIGFALADMLEERKTNIYCLIGDGELNEGQCWEGFMFAGNYPLNHLTVIIDRNNIQIDGHTESVMPLENLRDKLESFNFHVLEVDGHNIEAVVDACHHANSVYERPSAIIANTIPGKGVDFMEWKPEWHGKPPKEEEAQIADKELNNTLKYLRTLRGSIEYE